MVRKALLTFFTERNAKIITYSMKHYFKIEGTDEQISYSDLYIWQNFLKNKQNEPVT